MNQLGVILIGIAVILLALTTMGQSAKIDDLEARVEALEAAE